MTDFYYTYNNEAISSCIILSLLNRVEHFDIARACLLLPVLLDEKTVNHLGKLKENTSIDSLVKEQSQLFTSFNKRYLALLPIAINSIMILRQSGQISVSSTLATKIQYSDQDQQMGIRYRRIISVLPVFLRITEGFSTGQLYKILKVQL